MATFNAPFLVKLQPKSDRYFKKEDQTERGGGRFAIQVYPNGTKQFYLLYFINGKPKKLSLSNFDPENAKQSLEDARKKYNEYSAYLKEGLDPKAVIEEQQKNEELEQRLKDEQIRRENAQGSFKQLIDCYLDFLEKNRSSTHFNNARKALYKGDVDSLFNIKANKITKEDILFVLRKLVERDALPMTNKLRTYLSGAFGYGIKLENSIIGNQGNLEFNLFNNPVVGIPPLEINNTRERFLNEREVKILWDYMNKSSAHPPTQQMIKFILATGGQRIEQTRLLEWSEIKGDLWECPSHKTKNGTPNIVVLNQLALNVLSETQAVGDYVFYGSNINIPMSKAAPQRSIKRGQLGIEDFQLRDLRSTFKTLSGQLGISKEMRDKIQHHADNDVSSKHYDRYDYLPEKRRAMKIWGDYLQRIIDGKETGSNVVEFKRVSE